MRPLAQARRALYEALKPLLDEGRVQEYPDGTPVTPCITIGSPRLGTRSTGTPASTFTTATFPVVIRADGNKGAALALLDDLALQVWRAGNALHTASRCVSSSPSTTDAIGTGTSTTPTHTIDVEIGVDPIAWCPAAPEEEQP